MHALGFYHEHTRFDRDNWYIDVQWDNIKSGLADQFTLAIYRTTTNTFGTCYDYKSIMHYSWNA